MLCALCSSLTYVVLSEVYQPHHKCTSAFTVCPGQILHYKDGEKYEPHHDFFHDTVNARPENGGQRIATVLIYLCAAQL